MDYNRRDYERFLENCAFTDDELQIFALRRRGKSIVQISVELAMSESMVNRRIHSIKRRIAEEERQKIEQNPA